MPAANDTSITAEILRRTDAIQIGRDNWTGRCPMPAHWRGDRNRSLRIRRTAEKLLLYCPVCGKEATREIVSALRLPMASLSRTLTPAERTRMHEQRIVQRREEDRQAIAERTVAKRCRLLANLVDALFVRLLVAEGAQADDLAGEWHAALSQLRDAEAAWERLRPFTMPKRCSTCGSDACPHWQNQIAMKYPHRESEAA